MKKMRNGSPGPVGTVRPLVSAVISTLLLIVPACGSKDNPTGPSGGGGGGTSGPAAGTMTATIDGVAWSGTITVASIATGNNLVVSATDRPGSPGMLTLVLNVPAQVGTQTVGATSLVTGALVQSTTVSWLAAGPTGAGSVTVSTLTSTTATGTFSFTLVANLGAGQNRAVTNGAFNARIPTP